MGSRHDKSEICVQLQSYNLVRITETWWDGSHDWSTVTEKYRPYKKDKKTRRESCIYMRKQLECMKLFLRMDEEPH